MHDYTEWYGQVYPHLSGNGIWLRGGELNTLAVGEYQRRQFRVLFARLSTYRDTAESFTHKLLYQITAGIDGVFPDLAYLPPPRDAAIMSEAGVPWLVGTGTKRGPDSFDLLGISNSVVLELLNLAPMLSHSGIPLSKAARIDSDGIPLVILGGANAVNTSVLFTSDPLVDGIFAGGGPSCITRIVAICRDGKRAGLSKRELLSELRAVDGFLEPDSPQCTRVVSAAPAIETALRRGPIVYEGEMAGTGNIQISEGCACFCSFCFESWNRKPYREIPREQVHAAALALKAGMAVDHAELYSFNFNMHREFFGIMWDMAALFPSIGLKSQRFDAIANDPNLLGYLHAVGKTSLTCGLEGISERLRAYLHKSLPESTLRRGIAALARAPIRELKVFLIATGREQAADFDEFKELLRWISQTLQSAGRKPRIVFSMTPLVRFGSTPLEFDDAPEPQVVRDVLLQSERIARGHGFEFRVSADQHEYWISQVLARARDMRIAGALARAAATSGFVYYQEITPAFVELVQRELAQAGIDTAQLLRGAESDGDADCPWRHFDTGVTRQFIVGKWRDARGYVDRGHCLGSHDEAGLCAGCGGCDDEGTRNRITAPRAKPSFSVQMLRERVALARRDTVERPFHLVTGERARGIGPTMVATALARAILLKYPDLVTGYRGFARSAIQEAFGTPWVTGHDTVWLKWSCAAAAALDELAQQAGFIGTLNGALDGWAVVESPGELTGGWQLTFDSPYPFEPQAYLARNHLKYTLLRANDRVSYQLSRDSLKKRVIRQLSLEESGASVKVRVAPGDRFDLSEFVSSSFKSPSPADKVRIAIVADRAGEL